MLAVSLEIGVDIAPLLAGSGVVGLAIGFGSQTRIREMFEREGIKFAQREVTVRVNEDGDQTDPEMVRKAAAAAG